MINCTHSTNYSKNSNLTGEEPNSVHTYTTLLKVDKFAEILPTPEIPSAKHTLPNQLQSS